MNSPKNKTQQQRTKIKNLSALLAIGLALVTLLQASTVKSENAALEMTSIMEAELSSEVDQWFAEKEMFFEAEAKHKTFKVFDSEGNLLKKGNPQGNEELRMLVNQAEFMSEFADEQYYTLTK